MGEFEAFNLSVPAIIGYIFGIFALVHFILIIKRRRGEIWEAIKGEDKKLQLTEIAALYWFALFPVMFFGDLFFHIDVPDKIWYSMDTIFTVIILGHTAAAFNKSKNGNNQQEQTDKLS